MRSGTDITVTQLMLQWVEELFAGSHLKSMLQAFIREKAEESTIWSELTRNTHYMLGGDSASIDRAAAMTEMVMLLLDIVDDLQDKDNTEKGWMKCPEADVLNAILAFHAMMCVELPKFGSLELSERIGRLLAQAISGQHTDVTQAVMTEEDYIAMVRQKSGSLMQLACLMGYSLVDGLPQETIERVNELAECMGVIAQISNDIRDVLRYDVKNDLLFKKRTLPILFMLEDSLEEFPALARYYEGSMTVEQFLQVKAACMQYIRDCGCIEYSQVIRNLFADRAKELLNAIPGVSPWKERFEKMAMGNA